MTPTGEASRSRSSPRRPAYQHAPAWAQGQQPKPALIYKGQAVGNVPCAGGKNVQAARIRKEEQEAAKAKATAAAVAGEGK